MWFHGSFRADEWLLYEMTSPAAGNCLGLSFGHIYRRDTGALVVSCAQQGVVRLARKSAVATGVSLAMHARRWWQGGAGSARGGLQGGGAERAHGEPPAQRWWNRVLRKKPWAGPKRRG